MRERRERVVEKYTVSSKSLMNIRDCSRYELTSLVGPLVGLSVSILRSVGSTEGSTELGVDVGCEMNK